MRNKIMSVAVAVASAVTFSASASAPAGATSTAPHWEFVAAYPKTTAGYKACMAVGKQWEGASRCTAWSGKPWSRNGADYHLEISTN
ncbi:hypothetical protein GCM10022419_023060 [Nonomuraea rosea]|uniref:Uncharacterized protein n=1 Tax=Nonomuraea rosea TaxID=638574 RepID=A0ABP6VVU3_9ACTN